MTFTRSYLFDIIFLALGGFGLIILLERVVLAGVTSPYILFMVIPFVSIVMVWFTLRLRGERLSVVGLKKPDKWGRAVFLGLAISAALFVVSVTTEALGYERDLSGAREYLEGDFAFMLFGIFFGLVGAGFAEELLFRGFFLNRMENMAGGGRLAVVLAILFQATVFGLGHFQQGLYGMAYTGSLAIVLGCILRISGGNLWPLIIGHGVYDAVRFVYFYIIWTY